VLYTDEFGEAQSLSIEAIEADGEWTIDDVYVDPYRKGRPTL
jgi:hypothetical protein